MRKLLFGLVLVLICLSTESTFAQQTIIDFYPVAESLIAQPPYKPRLKILGQHKISNRYITLIGFKEDKSIFIAAVTLEPIKDVMKEIALSVKFNGLTPDVGKTKTWGYIFDRNGDGAIDYMALLGGAAPFKDSQFPADYPYRGESLLFHHMQYFAKQCKLAFNHWADDNFDGKLDALIHVDMERDRDYVERRIIIRSTMFDGKFDEVWALRLFDDSVQDSIPHTETSVPYRAIGGKEDVVTDATLAEKSEILKLLNSAIKKSKFTAKNFYQLER